MAQKVLTGIVIDERVELSLHDLSQACSSSTEWVIQLVDEGVLEPSGGKRAQWRFPGSSLSRALTATRLREDLGLNPAGVALALEMLDEIENLRAQLRRIEAGRR
jgi:chaperone modulatory protein CbpM